MFRLSFNFGEIFFDFEKSIVLLHFLKSSLTTKVMYLARVDLGFQVDQVNFSSSPKARKASSEKL